MRLLRLQGFFIAALTLCMGYAQDNLEDLFEVNSSFDHKSPSAGNYCSAQLNGHYTNMRLDGDCTLGNIENDKSCDVQATSGECSVDSLTCRYGSFHPPRAACKSRQCGNWSGNRSDAFGKIAELDNALSYVYTDGTPPNERRMVQLVVYVNELWADSNIQLSLTKPEPGKCSDGSSKDKKTCEAAGKAWTPPKEFKDMSKWKRAPWNDGAVRKIPDYFLKDDGEPCVVAYRLQADWSQWVNKLDTTIRPYDSGQVNLNQLHVEIMSDGDYTAWDPRLPNAKRNKVGDRENRAQPAMIQDIHEKLNVIIEYPRIVVAATPSFTLTDKQNVDIQVVDFSIDEMRWEDKQTSFTMNLDMESQTQAPYKLANFGLIGEGLCVDPDGGTCVAKAGKLQNVCDAHRNADDCDGDTENCQWATQCASSSDNKATCERAKDASDNKCLWRGMVISAPEVKQVQDCAVNGETGRSANGRFFTADNPDGRSIKICAQRWHVSASVTMTGCEVPIGFGFQWNLNCIDALYKGEKDAGVYCPLASTPQDPDRTTKTLSNLVNSPDLLWICPHMVSEHPVWTTFRTYRNKPTDGVAAQDVQKVFIEEKTVYSQIDLETAWGFLGIEDAKIKTFRIEYNRDPMKKAGDNLGCGRCVAKDSSEKCEEEKDEGRCAVLASECDWKAYGTPDSGKCIYDLVMNGVDQVTSAKLGGQSLKAAIGYEDADASTAIKAYTAGDGADNNSSHYRLGFNFVLKPDVFPQPYFNCDTDNPSKKMTTGDGMKDWPNYKTQDLLINDKCDFTKGEMVFHVELEVTYVEESGRRRRALIDATHSPHSATASTSTVIQVESTAEAQYEAELDVEAVRHFAAIRSTTRKQEAESLELQEQEDEPTGGGPGRPNWEIPVGSVLGVAALLLFLILLCWLHRREKKSDKNFDESMAGLLQRYPKEGEDVEKEMDRTTEYDRIRDMDKEEDVEDSPLDCVTNGDSIMVPLPNSTSVSFGHLVGLEDAPDPDDLPPVPTHRRSGNSANASLAANSTRGTILHAVHSVQSVRSCRSVTSEQTQISRQASNTTQAPRTDTRSCNSGGYHSSKLTSYDAASAVVRAASTTSSRITSKPRTLVETATMSTHTGYGADNPATDAPV